MFADAVGCSGWLIFVTSTDVYGGGGSSLDIVHSLQHHRTANVPATLYCICIVLNC